MVISVLHLMTTRKNLRIAHKRQLEKELWEEEHGSGKFDLYQRRQKKRKPVQTPRISSICFAVTIFIPRNSLTSRRCLLPETR